VRDGKDDGTGHDVNQVEVKVTFVVRMVTAGSGHRHKIGIEVLVEDTSVSQYSSLRENLLF